MLTRASPSSSSFFSSVSIWRALRSRRRREIAVLCDGSQIPPFLFSPVAAGDESRWESTYLNLEMDTARAVSEAISRLRASCGPSFNFPVHLDMGQAVGETVHCISAVLFGSFPQSLLRTLSCICRSCIFKFGMHTKQKQKHPRI